MRLVCAGKAMAAALLLMIAPLARAQTTRPAAPQLTAIRIEPQSIRLDRPGATQQILVIGSYSDGTPRDVTGQAQFASSRPEIAAVSKAGRIEPASDGTFTVTAIVGGKRASSEVVIQNFKAPTKWSFVNQITPILTYGGCNQSSCHGSPVGKNGFKLSLFGYHPDLDYAALVTQVPGRRVNTKDIDKSLVLLKPTFQIAHGGGLRFPKDSPEYKTLRAWIEAGAPFGEKETPVLAKLEVRPGYRVLTGAQQKQRLLVTAIYSDGTREDVTPKAVYTSNDDAILKVDRVGVATPAGGNGDAAIMVRYGGQVAVAVLGATMLPPPRGFPAPPDNLIDREI
ncbi:MAG TPA: Ig-like domain-containing protein, partial [Bryobacterales bacterium]|nr:Ig-like domain-containing protein [Bryobacterales bacterium]